MRTVYKYTGVTGEIEALSVLKANFAAYLILKKPE